QQKQGPCREVVALLGTEKLMKRREARRIVKLSFAGILASGLAIGGEIMPDALKVPGTQELSLEVQATGVQVYECKASKDEPTRFEWVFKAPEAVLLDSAGKKIGRH